MNVLMIGGSGYLGSLVMPFFTLRHEIMVFDLRPPEDTSLSFVRGSVCDPTALTDALVGMDTMLYMAMGSHPSNDGDLSSSLEARITAFDVNIKGLHLALYAAHQAGIRHAVYTSSMSIYLDNGLGRLGADEETTPDATWAYGFTKRLGEEVCRNACREWNMSVNALRLYFPVTRERWIAEAAKERPLPVTNAEDTARALLAALEYRSGYEAFHISGDSEQKTMNLGKAKRLLDWTPTAHHSLS